MPDKPQTTCDVMKQARLEALPAYPQRKNLDEQTYRQQLIDYYQQMRKQQYLYTVKNEGMKLYNGIGISRRNSNDLLWLPPERQPACLADTAANGAYSLMDRTNQGHLSQGNPTCAMAANSLSDQICRQMGFEQFIGGRGAQVTAGSTLASSQHVKDVIQEMCNSSDPAVQKRGDYIRRLNATSGSRAWVKDENNTWVKGKSPAIRKSVSELIENGTLQPGDAFGHESKTNSGSHAVTLADVVRDEQGKVVGYTLQACNQTKYQYYDIATGRNLKVTNIAPLSYYTESQIQTEVNNLKNMNIESIEATCRNTEQNTRNLINDLHETEETNRTLQIPSDVKNINRNLYVGSKGYNKELLYVQSQKVVTDQEQSMQSENGLTSDFLNKYQQQNPQTSEKGLTNEFKQKYQQSADGKSDNNVAKVTESKDNKKQAEQPANTPNISYNSSNDTRPQRSYIKNPYLMNRGGERV